MPLAGSGTISIGGSTSGRSVNLEFGRAAGATTSMSQLYRGGGIVPNASANNAIPTSGPISLSQFYNATNQFAFTISTNQTNANLRTLAVNAGWDQSIPLLATIGSGVYISSNSVATPALTVNGAFPGGVTLVNNGFIVGMGGAGGRGRGLDGTGADAGGAGGGALSVSTPISINNNGTIAGGGGGGGGGAAGWFPAGTDPKNSSPYPAGDATYTGGGGGGGASGLTASSGGAGGSGAAVQFAGGAGASGGTLAAGAGGGAPSTFSTGDFGGGAAGGGNGSQSSVVTNGVQTEASAGGGGGGGSNGAPGGSGANVFASGGILAPAPISRGASGGGGGFAVSGNGNVTWLATGTRLGGIA